MFLEEVHAYKFDIGLDEEELTKKIDETDVFDTLAEIKQRVETDA